MAIRVQTLQTEMKFSISLLEEQARTLAETVSVDRTNHSVSFNEFLKLMSLQREIEPDEETLLDMFR